MGWFWCMCVGFFLEFVGFLFAALGLWQTWRANAQGRPFFPLFVRRAAQWIAVKVFSRAPRHVTIQGGASLPAVAFAGAGFVSLGFTDDMSMDAKLDVVQANALLALEDASRAQSAVREEQRTRERALAELQSRLAGTEATLTEFARGLVVDGIPVAVLGLVFAVGGLALQGIASAVTFFGVF